MAINAIPVIVDPTIKSVFFSKNFAINGRMKEPIAPHTERIVKETAIKSGRLTHKCSNKLQYQFFQTHPIILRIDLL